MKPCECGCNILVKKRFVSGHNSRTDNPFSNPEIYERTRLKRIKPREDKQYYCKCGCGALLELAKYPSWQRKFVNSHNLRLPEVIEKNHIVTKNMKRWNKGLGIEDERVRKLGRITSQRLSGKTYEQIHGLEKAKQISLKKSLTTKGKPHSEEHNRNVLKAVCNKPNRFEILALDYINSIYNNKFKWCGDGSILINRRSCDAISQELNTVCLFNGVYWHLKQFGFENNDKSKGAIELIESLPFISAGYKVIFIWEDELSRKHGRKYG